MNLTVENTKCGLGDMLHRIDTIYRYCVKYGHIFHMPDISSNLHNSNYDELLGITNYQPHRRDWKHKVRVVGLRDLVAESTESKDTNDNHLISVAYDHAFSKDFRTSNNLDAIPRLDYSPYLNLLKEHIPKKNIDVLLHLRMGDSYIYQLDHENFFNSRYRKISKYSEIPPKDIREQWSINDVLEIVQHCNIKGLSYKILCDGVESIHRHLRWTKDEQTINFKNDIVFSANKFESELLDTFKENKNFIYGSNDVAGAILDVLSSKLIIFTTGGFAVGINKFLSPQPSKYTQIKGYLDEIKLLD
ncbi:hypothetical protein [Oceanimonas marisflavi]|uniref:hypothetical protein n=1 Tax=Oceanimonas marisflavi TaxID=2059724 RepID=UPI0013006864|nr:hypothetical protein [Oceanimonas marisflavi]